MSRELVAFALSLGLWLLSGITTSVFAQLPAIALETGTHVGPIRRLAADPSGTVVVTASDDKTARIWNARSGRLQHVLRIPIEADEVGRLYGAALSPDNAHVAIAGTTARADGLHRVHVFGVTTGAYERSFDAIGADVKRLAWLPGGEALAAVYAARPAVRIFDAQGRMIFEERLSADAYGLSVSRQGQVAVASFDGRVRLYRAGPSGWAREAEFATRLTDPVGVSHSPDGSLLAVGYFSRRGVTEGAAVDVYDLATRTLVRQFDMTDVTYGNLMSVAWRSDGKALYAAGTGYRDAGVYLVKHIDWPEGRVTEGKAPGGSILDIAALADGTMLLASSQGTWGALNGLTLATRSFVSTANFLDPKTLRVSADASVVAWQFEPDGEQTVFDLARRRFGEPSRAVALDRASSTSWRLAIGDWENTRRPTVAGRAVVLLPNELSRAASVAPDGNSVLLGTSRALRRFDARGEPLWSVPLNTEARALGTSANGQLLVAAQLDGTIRWRRASDGALLLSLLPLRDGRHVLWTEQGYYDASSGAEDLAGWQVTRPGGDRADFFGNSRFRDRYHRPDVIDRVLTTLDVDKAVSAANEERRVLAMRADEETRARVAVMALPPPPVASVLPPVVTLTAPPKSEPAKTEVALDYEVFTSPVSSGSAPPLLIVKVDGRPVEVQDTRREASSAGVASGRISIQAPEAGAVIQVLALSKATVSMPAEVVLAASAVPKPPAAAPKADRRPNLFVLAVGVSEYGNPEMNLGLAAKDAIDFSAVLARQDGAFYKRVETRVLTNQRATRRAVLDGLKWLQDSTGTGDVGVLFLAGHGVTSADNLYYFLPHDAVPANLARSAVSEVNLRSSLSMMKGRSLFFVDTCFSGKSLGRFPPRDLIRMANSFSSADAGIVVFAASAPQQESLELDAWGNGAFTKALVEGLSGRADFRREGQVTHKGLDYFVAHEVAQLTKGLQTPVTTVPSALGDFGIAAVLPSSKTESIR